MTHEYPLNELEAFVSLDEIVDKLELRSSQKLTLIKAKEYYDQKIMELGNQLIENEDILFSQRENGFPSRAIENARCLKYNEPYLNNHIDTLMFMLKILGAVSEK